MIRTLSLIAVGVLALASHANEAELAPRATKSLMLNLTELADGRYVAVGERGHILHSDDQGQTWQQAPAPTRATLTAVARSNGHVFAGGHDGVLLVSNDRGDSWNVLRSEPSSDQDNPILDIHFSTESIGYAVGAYGLFLHTNDGGQTWQQEEVAAFDLPDFGFPHLYRLITLRDNSLLVVGEAGFVARSTDQGANWTRLNVPYEGTFFTARQTASGALIVAGMRGNLFRSADNGASWSHINTGVHSGLNDIAVGTGEVIVVGMDGMMLISRDDGLSFARQQRSNRKAIAAVELVGTEQLLIAAEDGVSVQSLAAEQAK
ncbi:sialidase [Permianibacter sp. IMCC34836]|uniref:WD40/YVTN/BNR-like repeat-containing protein n=1 Tax=Permianibacter fluminis TaxID=2738515 RepID=UPI001555C5DC|nr:YCF48-related protein [Permianibacter fluminis]NQD37256.1 sialidase [Permianibacter fluminis]